MKKMVVLILLFVPISLNASIFEIGIGWENMGISPETTWKPYPNSRGSRKAIIVHAGWRSLGLKRIYFSNFFRLQYGYNWSLSGAMHLLEGQFGLIGIGIFLSKPLGDFNKEDRIGRWFSTLEINLVTLSFGGNIGGDSGGENQQLIESGNNQQYAYGKKYDYFHYSSPIRIQFWKELQNMGIGMFFEAEGFIIERAFEKDIPQSIGYNITSGLIFKL